MMLDSVPRKILILDEKSLVQLNRTIFERQASVEQRFPRTEDELLSLLEKADHTMKEAKRLGMDVKVEVQQTLDTLQASIDKVELKELPRAFANAKSKFCVRFEVWDHMYKSKKPAEYAMKDGVHIVYLPSGYKDDRGYGPSNSFIHELGHFIDASMKDGDRYAHSTLALFLKSFALDKQQHPDGLAINAIKVTDSAEYTDDHTPRHVIDRENFSNALMLYAEKRSEWIRDYPDSPLTHYFQHIVEKQIEELCSSKGSGIIKDHLGVMHGMMVEASTKLGENPEAADLSAAIVNVAEQAGKYASALPTWVEKIAQYFPYPYIGPGAH